MSEHGVNVRRTRRYVIEAGFYDDPAVYDVLHSPGTSREIKALIRVEQQFVTSPARARRWLEPACGSGRCLRAARRLGIVAHGFDLSQSMVDYAQDSLKGDPDARVWQADMGAFRDGCRGRYSFAFSTINTIRHLESDDALLGHLGEMAVCLRKGGVYVVGIGTMTAGEAEVVEDVWHGARGRLRVTQMVQYLPPQARSRLETVVSSMQVSRPRGDEFIHSTYRLRTYTPEQWRRAVEASAMREIAAVDDEVQPVDTLVAGYALRVLAPR